MNETDFNRATDALTGRLETLLKDNYALTRSLDAERDESARLLAAVGRVEGENSALREVLEPGRATSEQIADMASRIDVLTDQVARLVERVQSTGVGSVSVHGGRDEAAEKLHAVLTSRSWRITRPIRGLGRVVRRLRG